MERNERLTLHEVDGGRLDLRASEILFVDRADDSRQPGCGARVVLTATDSEGCNKQVFVVEPANAIAHRLSELIGHGEWGAG